ncbi:MAG: DUF2059 domain-containing protein [Bacteroidota bacterium]
MTAKAFFIAAALFFAAFNLYAQDNSSVKQDVLKLLEITGTKEEAAQTADNFLELYRDEFPDVPESFWVDFGNDIQESSLVNTLAEIYIEYFTHEEINKLIDFYDLGKKLAYVYPIILEEYYESVELWGDEIAEKLFNRLEEEGYIEYEDDYEQDYEEENE